MFEMMFYGGLLLALFFLLLSIYFFVKNNVAKLIGDVSGWNARKAIRKINKKGAEDKTKQEAIRKETSGVLVKNIGITGGLRTMGNNTTIEGYEEDEITVVLDEKQISEICGDDEITAVLDENRISEVSGDDEITVILEENIESQVCGDDEITVMLEGNEMPAMFEVEEEMIVIHTNDSIR